jgi:hypothetical protein
VCDRVSKRFRSALFEGDLAGAKALHRRTTLVNLRTAFPHDPDGEHPIHAAALTGDTALLKWLIFDELVPTKVRTHFGLSPMDFGE